MPRRVSSRTSQQWQIGKPDIVIKYPTFTVPAAGPDLFGNLYADIPITEGSLHQGDPDADDDREFAARWCITRCPLPWTIRTQDVTGDDSVGVDGGQFLVEYASGKNAEVLPGRHRRAAAGRQEGHAAVPPPLDWRRNES